MSYEVEPPRKKQKTNPCPSFLSLPDEIVVNCLARIPRSHYPRLCLVSKTFRSLILSRSLYIARFQLKTHESCLHVCLQLSDPTWFSLWIKPDQTLTNDLEKKKKKKKKKKKSTKNTLLVRTPSSYFNNVPMFTVAVGSEYYGLSQKNGPSSVLWVCNKESWLWREATNMTVARERAVAGVLDGKIYVMGGCGENETASWGEVFDTKTQTWEPLPDPGPEIRVSKIKTLETILGKLYLRSNENEVYVYDPKEGKWTVAAKKFVMCAVENVWFLCHKTGCEWYDTKRKEWRVVRGLAALNRNPRCGLIEIANYGGKLLVLWDKFAHHGRREEKNIWCAVIAIERRSGKDDLWGKIEWANVVLTVPSSYKFVRSWYTL